MTYELVYNPMSGPVVVDDDGRSLAGGGYGPAETSAVRGLVEAGALVRIKLARGAKGPARDAADRVDELNKRLDGLKGKSVDDLATEAVEAGLLADGATYVADRQVLLRALAHHTAVEEVVEEITYAPGELPGVDVDVASETTTSKRGRQPGKEA
jgi:hypothetical protein